MVSRGVLVQAQRIMQEADKFFPEGEPLGGGIALGHLDEFAVGTG